MLEPYLARSEQSLIFCKQSFLRPQVLRLVLPLKLGLFITPLTDARAAVWFSCCTLYITI